MGILDNLTQLANFVLRGKATRGKSASVTATYNENNEVRYQVKYSNSTKMIRKLTVDPDSSDMLGEFLASLTGRAVLNNIDNSGIEKSPEVGLVHDENTGRVILASKYLNDDHILPAGRAKPRGMIIDELAEGATTTDGISYAIKPKIKAHCRIVIGKASRPNDIVVDQEYMLDGKVVSIPKKDLCNALKESFIRGDHDINPGNLYFVFYNGQSHIGRIDWGHAYNEMVKDYMGDHSPKFSSGRGCVLDSINRTFLNGSRSKFLRDYSGLLPDIDFARTLQEGLSDRQGQALNAAHEQFQSALKAAYDTGNKKLQNELTKSLYTLSSRMGKKIKDKKLPFNKLVETVSENGKTFEQTTREECKSVGRMIEVQCLVDEMLKGGNKKTNLEKIDQLYKADNKYLKGKSVDSKIEWTRTDRDKTPFKGSLIEYVKHRGQQLGVTAEAITTSKEHLQNMKWKAAELREEKPTNNKPISLPTWQEKIQIGRHREKSKVEEPSR